MAIQRMSVRMCDVHLRAGKKVEGIPTPMKLDLCEEHMSMSVREALAFLNGGTSKTIPRQRKKAAGSNEPTAKVVRAWAHETGVECPATGRVPKSVVDAYLAAV